VLELALRRPRDASGYVEMLRSAMEEAERLTLLVEALLALARIDAGQERGPVETLSLTRRRCGAASRWRGSARSR